MTYHTRIDRAQYTYISIYYFNLPVDPYVRQTLLIYHTVNFKSIVLKIKFLKTFIVILNHKLCSSYFSHKYKDQ